MTLRHATHFCIPIAVTFPELKSFLEVSEYPSNPTNTHIQTHLPRQGLPARQQNAFMGHLRETIHDDDGDDDAAAVVTRCNHYALTVPAALPSPHHTSFSPHRRQRIRCRCQPAHDKPPRACAVEMRLRARAVCLLAFPIADSSQRPISCRQWSGPCRRFSRFTMEHL